MAVGQFVLVIELFFDDRPCATKGVVLQQENRSFDPADQDRGGTHRTWFERGIDRGALLEKITRFRAVSVKQLRSIIFLDGRRRAARPLLPDAGDGRSQHPLFAVLDRTLVGVNLVLLERQNLSVHVVDHQGVDVQTVKVRRLGLADVRRADGRIEAQMQGRDDAEEGKRVAFSTKKREVSGRFHSSLPYLTSATAGRSFGALSSRCTPSPFAR